MSHHESADPVGSTGHSKRPLLSGAPQVWCQRDCVMGPRRITASLQGVGLCRTGGPADGARLDLADFRSRRSLHEQQVAPGLLWPRPLASFPNDQRGSARASGQLSVYAERFVRVNRKAVGRQRLLSLPQVALSGLLACSTLCALSVPTRPSGTDFYHNRR